MQELRNERLKKAAPEKKEDLVMSSEMVSRDLEIGEELGLKFRWESGKGGNGLAVGQLLAAY